MIFHGEKNIRNLNKNLFSANFPEQYHVRPSQLVFKVNYIF